MYIVEVACTTIRRRLRAVRPIWQFEVRRVKQREEICAHGPFSLFLISISYLNASRKDNSFVLRKSQGNCSSD